MTKLLAEPKNFDWVALRQLSVVIIAVSVIHMFGYYGQHAETLRPSGASRVIEGELIVRPRVIKGITYFGAALKTESEVMPLSCRSEPTQDCFPGIAKHEGSRVSAKVQKSLNGSVILQEMVLVPSGELIVGEKFFTERQTHIRYVYSSNSIWFGVLGIIGVALSTFVMRKSHKQAAKSHD